MDCRVIQKHLSAYVDGELEPSRMLEVEQHLGTCGDCQVDRTGLVAIKRELRIRVVAPAAPHHLRGRVQAALRGVEPERQGLGPTLPVVASVAASLLLVFGSLVGTDRRIDSANLGMVTPLEIARQVVDRHKDELPAEIATKEPQRATSWFRDKVGFRVRSVAAARSTITRPFSTFTG